MLNLTVHGARISLSIGLLATFVTVALGVVVGIVAGFVGGFADSGLMRVTDFFLVIPTFVLALILTPIIQDVVGSAATRGVRDPDVARRDHLRHRHHELVVDRADHPVADAVAAGAGVRRPCPGRRVEQRPHHATAHPAERHQPHRRQRGADLRRRGPHSRRRSRSSASATRSSRRGARRSRRPGPSARRGSAPGGTSARPASASSSSSWRSRSSATPSTTSSTRSGGRAMTARSRARRTPATDAARAGPPTAPEAGGPGRPAARRRGPQDALHARRRDGPCGRRRELPPRPGRGARDRRRVGLRQDDDRAVARPDPAAERLDRRGQHQALRDRPRPKSDEALRRYRWREIAIVFQGAMNALNPVHRVRDQIAEPLMERLGVSEKDARAAPASCWSWSASPGSGAGPTPTSSRAGCASGR